MVLPVWYCLIGFVKSDYGIELDSLRDDYLLLI